jgi:TetR/AcrR family transcriptional regulator, mexJK operon transcriptional repressor
MTDARQPCTPATAARGRPKDPRKREAILKSAKTLFATRGYIETSMDALAQQAGVSKLTVYSHFADKDALLTEVVISTCETHAPQAYFDPDQPLPLEERLLRIGSGFVDLIMDPEVVGFYRMMAAHAANDSHLATVFYNAGPARTIAQFAALLRRAHERNELCVPDAVTAAEHFFCLLKGVHHLRVLVGCAQAPDPAAREAHVASAVNLFLAAHRG